VTPQGTLANTESIPQPAWIAGTGKRVLTACPNQFVLMEAGGGLFDWDGRTVEMRGNKAATTLTCENGVALALLEDGRVQSLLGDPPGFYGVTLQQYEVGARKPDLCAF
jgi:hypothetical protein